ncbi:helix-turn-helix transcriptional regulator [Hymenobacter sp. YC55]|uniref:helix-turn-helix domain-containing protein n=1 Tax=Hymenobacter sp. YC55 TaxID=3034019 RepID=UPI0023F8DC31|nr:helix-turn-helix transcriptional regulator [Hymenobacter sp. YC55]MDF7814898.1 helix-turn-helix transcriptional regulator [Hymenobacter sp. YC55]
MLPSESLKEFHQHYLREHLPELPQPFNVFPIATGVSPQSLPYSRRDFYQISLYTGGTTHLQYAGHSLQIESPALLLYNPLAPYSCTPITPLSGYCCLFTSEFMPGPGYSVPWQESPLFQLGASPVFLLTDEQATFLTQLFQQMLAEVSSTYRYKLDLLRTHVHLLLHEALRMQPDLSPLADATAASRLATQFLQLLEAQFPVSSPTQPLSVHTAEACAARLGVHVNYLSRVLREATGRPTSSHLALRITQEAKRLLRYSNWPVADIAEGLGFADPTYFNHFFRKHAGTSPAAFRRASTALLQAQKAT